MENVLMKGKDFQIGKNRRSKMLFTRNFFIFKDVNRFRVNR